MSDDLRCNVSVEPKRRGKGWIWEANVVGRRHRGGGWRPFRWWASKAGKTKAKSLIRKARKDDRRKNQGRSFTIG